MSRLTILSILVFVFIASSIGALVNAQTSSGFIAYYSFGNDVQMGLGVDIDSATGDIYTLTLISNWMYVMRISTSTGSIVDAMLFPLYKTIGIDPRIIITGKLKVTNNYIMASVVGSSGYARGIVAVYDRTGNSGWVANSCYDVIYLPNSNEFILACSNGIIVKADAFGNILATKQLLSGGSPVDPFYLFPFGTDIGIVSCGNAISNPYCEIMLLDSNLNYITGFNITTPESIYSLYISVDADNFSGTPKLLIGYSGISGDVFLYLEFYNNTITFGKVAYLRNVYYMPNVAFYNSTTAIITLAESPHSVVAVGSPILWFLNFATGNNEVIHYVTYTFETQADIAVSSNNIAWIGTERNAYSDDSEIGLIYADRNGIVSAATDLIETTTIEELFSRFGAQLSISNVSVSALEPPTLADVISPITIVKFTPTHVRLDPTVKIIGIEGTEVNNIVPSSSSSATRSTGSNSESLGGNAEKVVDMSTIVTTTVASVVSLASGIVIGTYLLKRH